MKIHVDRDKCVGAGQCAMTAPSVFDQDERDGIVILLAATPPAADEAAARRAVALCPARALRIVETE